MAPLTCKPTEVDAVLIPTVLNNAVLVRASKPIPAEGAVVPIPTEFKSATLATLILWKVEIPEVRKLLDVICAIFKLPIICPPTLTSPPIKTSCVIDAIPVTSRS